MRACLTNHEAHEFVGQDAGADESHPQADVKFPGALRLHPHKQADEGKANKRSKVTQVQLRNVPSSLLDFLQHICHLAEEVL